MDESKMTLTTKMQNPKTDGNEDIAKDIPVKDDQIGMRLVTVDTKDYVIRSFDPYALWKIQPLKGKLPKALEGAFTSPTEAERAIARYVNNVRK